MKWHGVKVGPGPRDPAIRDPPQSLKVGPGAPLKFKSGTPGPPSSLKVGLPPRPSSSFNEFIFPEYFSVFFTYLFLCLFLNKIQKNINCE